MIVEIWAIIATTVSLCLAIWHCANPYPLIQFPDWGHRLYAVPSEHHAVMLELLRQSGLEPFGTFTAGVRQTLFRDGFTVIASGQGLQKAAMSLPCSDPLMQAQRAQAVLSRNGIETEIWTPPEKDIEGKLVVVKLPTSFGWDIAYRLPGKDMPSPKWE